MHSLQKSIPDKLIVYFEYFGCSPDAVASVWTPSVISPDNGLLRQHVGCSGSSSPQLSYDGWEIIIDWLQYRMTSIIEMNDYLHDNKFSWCKIRLK